GLEYLSVVLPKNSLPNGNVQLQLLQGTTVVDQTTYSPNVGSSQTWARFKDPITGRPMDTNNDAADFYVSLAPSPARGNDRHRPTSAPEHGRPGLHRSTLPTSDSDARMGERHRVATHHHGREDGEPIEREGGGSRDVHDLLQ